jgi:hypothetical protein
MIAATAAFRLLRFILITSIGEDPGAECPQDGVFEPVSPQTSTKK